MASLVSGGGGGCGGAFVFVTCLWGERLVSGGARVRRRRARPTGRPGQAGGCREPWVTVLRGGPLLFRTAMVPPSFQLCSHHLTPGSSVAPASTPLDPSPTKGLLPTLSDSLLCRSSSSFLVPFPDCPACLLANPCCGPAARQPTGWAPGPLQAGLPREEGTWGLCAVSLLALDPGMGPGS